MTSARSSTSVGTVLEVATEERTVEYQLRAIAWKEGFRVHATRFVASRGPGGERHPAVWSRDGQFLLRHPFRDLASAFRMKMRIRDHLLEGGELDLGRWDAIALEKDDLEERTM